MAKVTKQIDEKTLTDQEELDKIRTLVASIRKRHALINAETAEMEKEKGQVKDRSVGILYDDLENEDPEVFNNHEYHNGDGMIRVSFKIKSRPFTEIGGKPASEAVDKIFKDHSDKLFSKQKTYTVEADEATRIQQACDHPECFRIALKPLTQSQLQELITEHPEFVTAEVTDPEAYAGLYPQHVTEKVTVATKNGFLETVAKVEKPILKAARKFIKALMDQSLQPSLCVGNKARKGKS